jgi:GNAT superfamily N-acetyltransferase
MSHDIVIRTATPADGEMLTAFNCAMAWETEQKRLDLDTVRAGVAAVFQDPRRGRYFVAERAGELVGGLLITYEWSDWRNGDWWWIQSVYVAEPARGLGVFRALYAEVEARARATPGVIGLRLYVEWENHRASGIYARLGMSQEHYHMMQKPWGTALGL